MRSKYNILWLDDAFIKPRGIGNNIHSIKKKIEDYVQSLGYIPNVITASSKEEVQVKLKSNPKIDIIFSDYNIDENYKGMDFLKDIRKIYLQEMMLYSNVDESEIKEYLIQNIKSDNFELQFLSKFIFQSMSNRTVLINSMKSLIDLTLIRWQELNALRGFCLAETSQLEEDAKLIFKGLLDFSEIKILLNNNLVKLKGKKKKHCRYLLNNLKSKIKTGDLNLFDFQLMLFDVESNDYNDFQYIRDLRNGFAHIREEPNSNIGNYIELKDGTKIFEQDIKSIRFKIFDVIDKFEKKLKEYQLYSIK